ncbi:hypothetical protein [Achromobacter sp.]|uniref:hypothetical protein n=1 Tax=Achromobacter sp. TaxID=134375 RepID=UPI0028B11B01|nr:hypothetical protein [Achromobacter sp.]
MSNIQNPGHDFSGAGPVEYSPAETRASGKVESLLASEESRLLATPGVVSVGVTTGRPGEEALAVGVTDANVAARLPREINGVPLVITVTGPVDAQRQR